MRWLLIILLALAVPALAVEFRNGDTVVIPQNETINDDLFVTGGTITVLGTIADDLVVAGGTVDVQGPVRGTIIAGGGTVTLRSTVGRNVVVGGGQVNVDTNAQITRDLVVGGGSVTLAGTVGRDVRAGAQEWAFGPNANLQRGTVTITDTARIGRDLYAAGQQVNIAPGATIGGSRQIQQNQRPSHQGPPLWIYPLLLGLWLLIDGLIFTAVASRFVPQAVAMLRAHPWAALLAGLVTLVVVPLTWLILLVVPPLFFIVMALYFIGLHLGLVIGAIVLGQLILRGRGGLPLALLIGVLLYTVGRLIPVLGGIVMVAGWLFGLGTLLLTLWARTRHPIVPMPETAPPAPLAAPESEAPPQAS